jgi:homoserine O-acetyltransferase
VDDYDVFELGDCTFQSGDRLPDARLIYKTHGTLDDDRRNAIVFPTHYGGTHADNEWLIGPGKALDPERYFIIVPNMLANGVSSSPSNTPPPHDRARFPHVTIHDNVALQHRLVTERFGVEHLPMVVGFSMGAQQAYQWAVSFPEMVERIVPICGSARTSPHNWVFLEGVTATLRADAAWRDGFYEAPPTVGLRALGRVWAGWGHSQAFYRQGVYRDQGYASLEDYIVRYWEDSFLSSDANDLLAMAWTWQHADVGATPGFDGSFERALRAITARTLVMPCATDLYFPPEDSAYEVQHIAGAELRPIPSIWGHTAGGGDDPADAAFIDDALKDWLAR